MHKSLAYDFLGLYRAILKDISVYHPLDQIEWDRDLSRLSLLSRTRGQATFTIDLPALGKALDRGLSDGRLEVSSLNLSRSRYPHTKIPRLFYGLWSRLFDYSGCLKDDIDPNDVLLLRTLLYVGKNLDWECSPRYLYEATKEFFDVESQLPIPDPFWDCDDESMDSPDWSYCPSLGRRPGDSRDLFSTVEDRSLETILEYVQQSADRITGLLGVFDPDEYSFRHGPGSVSDFSTGSYKYSFPNWGKRLQEVFPFDRYGVTPLGLMDRLQPSGLDVNLSEIASKLIAVPKTQKGPRLIASEPSSHMWAQQCIKDFLYTRVRDTVLGKSVHFNDQSHNQQRALLGSVDGAYGTLDLKSASDRISCHLVGSVFRRNPFLLKAMSVSRTRYLQNFEDKKQPKLVKLRKFSTQGSALTFPVQSLVFLAIALGVGKSLNPRQRWEQLHEKVLVFGDDIIVPKLWMARLASTLSGLGLKVNQTKTFSVGFFRESCGMDAWKGYDVTPPHITFRADESKPETVASCVAVSNNFFTKGLWHASDWVRSTVRLKNILIVSIGSGAFGFKSFSGAPIPGKTRWNKHLHRDEAFGLCISAKARKIKQDAAPALLQYFTERPLPFIKYESGIAVAGVPVYQHTWVPVASI